MANSISIRGFKKAGYNEAHNTIPSQINDLVREFNEISGCHQATINIELDMDLIVLNPDYRTSVITWGQNFTEIFDFLRIILILPRLNNREYQAWLYIPHNSPHRYNYNIHEILCAKIDDLSDREEFQIYINKNYNILPYHRNIIIV